MEIELLGSDGQPLARARDEVRPRRPRRRWGPWRSAVVVALVLAAVLVFGASAAVSIRSERLRADLDADLRRELGPALDDAARGTAPGAVAGDRDDGLVLQVLQSPGTVVAATPGIDLTMIAVNGPFDGSVAETKRLVVDGRSEVYRVTWAAVPTPLGVAGGTVVVIGLPVGPAEQAAEQFQALVAVAVVVTVVGAAVATGLVVRRRSARREAPRPTPTDQVVGRE